MIRCRQIVGVKIGKLLVICSVCILMLIIVSNFYNPNQLQFDENIHNLPLIFVGGHQSSGTGLLRILLDIHPMVRCGPEPIVTREILSIRWKTTFQKAMLSQSGITQNILDDAIAGFIVSILKNMGPPAERLCHKDPSSYIFLRDLSELFPKAKFIHAIRDGRGAIMSTIVRQINPAYKSNEIPQALKHWEGFTSQILNDCKYIGRNRCMTVRYECLVLNPKREIQKILDFLDLPWDDRLLNHEKFVNNTSMLNKYEASSVQVVKAIHKESLDAWAKENSIIPKHLITTLHKNSSLLTKLKYTYPPNYEKLCEVELEL